MVLFTDLSSISYHNYGNLEEKPPTIWFFNYAKDSSDGSYKVTVNNILKTIMSLFSRIKYNMPIHAPLYYKV